MVVVIPMITNNKEVFAIYSICISVGMFLSYADLGFFKAGLKYAGESYAKGNKEEEIEYHGFSGFLLFVFVSFLASVFFLLSFYPEILSKRKIKAAQQKITREIAMIAFFGDFLFSITDNFFSVI